MSDFILFIFLDDYAYKSQTKIISGHFFSGFYKHYSEFDLCVNSMYF